MKLTYVLLTITFSSFAIGRAAMASDADWHRLLRAKSAKGLAQSIHDNETLAHARRVCDVQLRAHRLPIACFEVLNLERHAGVISETRKVDQFRWLGELCEKEVKASHNWKELAASAKDPFVPAGCTAAAAERMGDLKYTAESESPAELFARRLDKD